MQIHSLPLLVLPVSERGRMDILTLQRTVKRAFAEDPSYTGFTFQGDGPLSAGQEFYDKYLLFEDAYNVNHAEVTRCVQTDARAITPSWAGYFSANGFLVGLTDMGGASTRFLARGQGIKSARMAKAMRILRRAGAEYTALARVTRTVAARPEQTYSYFKKHGLRHIQFAPPENTLHNRRTAPENRAYADFLCRMFDQWYADFKDGAYQSVRTFDNYVYMLLGGEPESSETGGVCNCAPLVDVDGSVYPCGLYRTARYRLGNVRSHTFSEMLTGEAHRRFSAPSGVLHPECHACSWLDMCGGGCWREREPVRNGQPAKDRYCAARREFFSRCAPRMAEIAASIAQPPS